MKVALFFPLFSAVAAAARPNILWILADDMESDYKQNRLDLMPNLRTQIRDQGLTFTEHVAAQPVCGPSRSSFLAGRYPHNVGYVVNDEKRSKQNWFKTYNNTIGTWITSAGYYTSFIGKGVNGVMESIPSGWRNWQSFSSNQGTYNYYNASIWNYTVDVNGNQVGEITNTAMTGIHQADFLGSFALEQVDFAVNENRPFFISVNPVMMHWGVCYSDPSAQTQYDPAWEKNLTCPDGGTTCCPDQTAPGAEGCNESISPCPSIATAHLFDNLTNPHVPSWNISETGGIPKVMKERWPGVTAWQEERENMAFRNRTASAVDLDRMIGVLIDGLAQRGVLDNTYVFFTSDNGFHLGEKKMVFGKEEPYETDVRLPFFVRGPGVPKNDTRIHPTNHIDAAATILDIANATPYIKDVSIDGLSFLPALTANPVPVSSWRNYSYSEFFDLKNTWVMLRYPETQMKFTYFCTDDAEIFDISTDTWELANHAYKQEYSSFFNQSLDIALAIHACNGTQACNYPTVVPIVNQTGSLACYKTQAK
jgi:N-acetylglucosamine-6-sulfatase